MSDPLSKSRSEEMQKAWDLLGEAVRGRGLGNLSESERDLYYLEHIWGRVGVDGFHGWLFQAALTSDFDYDALADALENYDLHKALVCWQEANECLQGYLLSEEQQTEPDPDGLRQFCGQALNNIEKRFYALEPQFEEALYQASLMVLNDTNQAK